MGDTPIYQSTEEASDGADPGRRKGTLGQEDAQARRSMIAGKAAACPRVFGHDAGRR